MVEMQTKNMKQVNTASVTPHCSPTVPVISTSVVVVRTSMVL